jgi:hypothetical protein
MNTFSLSVKTILDFFGLLMVGEPVATVLKMMGSCAYSSLRIEGARSRYFSALFFSCFPLFVLTSSWPKMIWKYGGKD